MQGKTLIDMLSANATENGEKPAILFHDTVLTYAGLDDEVSRGASGLSRLAGIGRGDRVAFMLPRTPELVTVFLSAIKAGAVAAPVNFELTAEMTREMLSGLVPKCLVVHEGLLEHAKASIPDGRGIRLIAVGDNTGGHLNWREVIEAGERGSVGEVTGMDDVVYLNYTSGSTGASKGALTTNENIYSNTHASVNALGLTPDDVHMCVFAPFAHPHEIFSRPLFLGGTMVIVDRIYPKSIAEAISRFRVTCMMGLPPMYENLLELIGHKHYDLSSLRVPESGGMYTRKELIDAFKEAVGVPIMPVWGSTETTGIAIATRPGSPAPQGSVGLPCPGYEVRIVDEDGRDLPRGDVGEMIFRGPGVVRGYYGMSGRSEANFRHGWYYSGDLGTQDDRGYLYFIERKTGMMKIAGLKVFPTEIEIALLEHPFIREASVISIRDRLRGEVPKAIIALKNGFAMTQKEVLGFLRQRIAHYKVPKSVEFRDALPKTPSGKIDKKALQAEAAAMPEAETMQ